jgi:predicted MPP superfamily phosphohydrolase
MKQLLLISFLLLIANITISQTDSNYSVYLIGDAGEDTVSGKALLMLKDELIKNPNSAVIFLGDNVYPSGLKLNDKKSQAHLNSELSILNNYKGKVFFIPGNHDWDAQQRKGLQILRNQEVYVDDYLKSKTSTANRNENTFLPSDGLPGPVSVMLNDKLRLIAIDTQWFLHSYKKNKTGSLSHTKELFYSHLDSLLSLAKKNNEQVVIAAHHPMYTNGQHSKSKQPIRFLINYTPLQIFGLLGVNRLLSQDIAQPKYKKMRKKMLGYFSKYDNIIYASGHEHNVQCFKEGATKYIVSGNGSKLSKLSKKKKFDSVLQDDTKTGFVKVVYDSAGNHKTIIYRVGEETKTLEGF